MTLKSTIKFSYSLGIKGVNTSRENRPGILSASPMILAIQEYHRIYDQVFPDTSDERRVIEQGGHSTKHRTITGETLCIRCNTSEDAEVLRTYLSTLEPEKLANMASLPHLLPQWIKAELDD